MRPRRRPKSAATLRDRGRVPECSGVFLFALRISEHVFHDPGTSACGRRRACRRLRHTGARFFGELEPFAAWPLHNSPSDTTTKTYSKRFAVEPSSAAAAGSGCQLGSCPTSHRRTSGRGLAEMIEEEEECWDHGEPNRGAAIREHRHGMRRPSRTSTRHDVQELADAASGRPDVLDVRPTVAG